MKFRETIQAPSVILVGRMNCVRKESKDIQFSSMLFRGNVFAMAPLLVLKCGCDDVVISVCPPRGRLTSITAPGFDVLHDYCMWLQSKV